jgi:thymidylate synthase
MRTIYARNVNDAWQHAIGLIEQCGMPEPSRNGPVVVAPWPVVTVYERPMERVLFDPVRDANPIFHLHEALWMLAGRNDATWLDQFVADFSARFAEKDGTMHGAYGYRWRSHFLDIRAIREDLDQLDNVVSILNTDASSRQAVIQMWDAEVDLGVPGLKDRPCNTQVYLRIHEGRLDLGVTCRSNDIVWGCYGANAVHFSILQEYLAARLEVVIGTMTQFSWNWHMYENARHLANHDSANGWPSYPTITPLVDDADTFDDEVAAYVDDPDSVKGASNTFLDTTARPMWEANRARKLGDYEIALQWADKIVALDWRTATTAWLKRRMK